MKPPRENLSDHRQFEQKKLDNKYIASNLFKYLKPHLPLIMLIFIGALVGNILSLLTPQLCGLAIDEIKLDGTTDMNAIYRLCIALLIMFVLSALITYLSSIGMNYVSRKLIKRLRKEMFDRLVTLPVSYFDNRQAGDIISVLSYDLDTLGASVSNDVIMLLTAIVTIIGSLVLMLINAPLLVLIFVVIVPITLIFTMWLAKKVHPLFRRRSRSLGQMNGFIEEIITGNKTTKAYSVECAMEQLFEEKNSEAVQAYTVAEAYGTLSGPSVTFFNNVALAFVSVLGALLYINGTITNLGSIASFVLYARKFTGPINEISNVISDLQSATAASERVFKVLDESSESNIYDGVTLENVKGDVAIDHLKFGYVSEKTIIHDFNLHANKGEVIAIVGHTGAGKTTIINLLMRFYDAESGTICIDGQDIMTLSRSSLRSAFTMVLQDTWLFAGSIYENIAYGNDNVTYDDVIRVCKEARIHSFISKLPNGYDTLLTDNAINISKGQKQLLTIARAMLLNSPMLILDEATSNVDTRTEEQVQDAMKKLMKGKTSFVIAHRLSTIKNADLILVMENGDIVEKGNHESLMKDKDGVYYKLYNSQFYRTDVA